MNTFELSEKERERERRITLCSLPSATPEIKMPSTQAINVHGERP
jgi:hypothetical protein